MVSNSLHFPNWKCLSVDFGVKYDRLCDIHSLTLCFSHWQEYEAVKELMHRCLSVVLLDNSVSEHEWRSGSYV